MKEITNRSAIFILPKKPFKEWAKLYNESPIDDLDQRLSEKHVYLLEWFHEEDIVDVLKPYYIEMDPLLIPVFQDNELAGTIQIVYKLEVFGNKNYKAVGKLKTKLGDALIKDFTYYIPRTLRKNQGLDVPLIKYRLKMVTDKVLGKGVVSEALIQGMIQTPAGGG